MKTINLMKTVKNLLSYIILLLISLVLSFSACSDNEEIGSIEDNTFDGKYVIVDTDQAIFYNNEYWISEPSPEEDFYGQDAHYTGNLPNYVDNGNGTITDLTTGLMWQQNLPDNKYDYTDCLDFAENSTLAGYTDWRLPTIKELYSLILFTGITGVDESSSVPYIDTDYFDFRYGTVFGERFIDAQYVSSTIYKGTTMDGNETMFGVNFADGRIKGYPTSKEFEIKLVRGNQNYGINIFVENNDRTISDTNTDLMWDADGSNEGMNWEEALAYTQQKNDENYLGYSDWRLPNAKELQSIVDYTRSPSYTNSAAISELFTVPEIINEGGETDYPFYWTSTTHYDGPSPSKAAYVSFGRALGYWSNIWQDVHGAGAQRSDPKIGDPADYPEGHGPQGDAIQIFNYVRLVRDL
ncbi:DUF1566 domain-containing protein [Bacteroidota bacterium]